ncbi:MAG: albA 1 [Firmicutes bacterium]|nr:albA 1 [Bacillota bacterium]
MYYRLQNYCKLVEGAKRGAIYNLQTGKVHSINQGALGLLTACRAKALEELLDFKSPQDQIFLDFLHRLTEMGLGSFFINQPSPTKKEATPPVNPPKLEFIWLELTSSCNNQCLHCYATSGPTSCSDLVDHKRWLELITEARTAGASAIQLIGGEPLLYRGWRELIEKAYHEKYDFIEIFTNATLINDDDITFFKHYNVNIATTIYADNAAVHDSITLNEGSFTKTFTAINKLLASGIPLRIASIIMKPNEYEVEHIMKLCANLGVEVTPPDVVRPTGRGEDDALLPTAYAKQPIKPPFYTDPISFAKAQCQHSCLSGKIAITASGDVIPCIFARSEICGNILQTPLAEVLNGPLLSDCWHTTKDKIEKCQHCEYRYACTDCRPLAQGSDTKKRWLACSSECSYNPYTGEWKDGTLCETIVNSIIPSGSTQK